MEPEAGYHDSDGEEEESASVTPREIVLFLVEAARRHRWLGVAVGAIIATLGVAAALVIPAKYEAHTRILASQSAAIAAALSNPNRPISSSVDPFAGSSEILKQKSNLIWIARETNLLAKWKESRSIVFRLKDSLMDQLRGPVSAKNELSGLADLLDQQMQVFHDGSVLNIQIFWRTADSTLQLAQVAQSRFLELWKNQELAAINAAIAINEEEVKRAAEGIDQSLGELIRIRQKSREATRGAASGSPTDKVRARRSAGHSTSALAGSSGTAIEPDKKLAARLGEIRLQIHELEVPWQRRIAELKFQLTDLRGTYGPEYPIVVQQEAKIKEASKPPPELVALRDRERQILSEPEQKPAEEARSTATVADARSGDSSQAGAQSRLISADGALLIAEREDDPVVAPAKANLTSAIQRYSEITKRLETARLELVSAQVALQYRYVVVEEPERPRRPTKPNRPLIILGAIVAGLLGAFLAGAVRDLLTGRIFAPWQVRISGLAVIGEVTPIQISRSAPPGPR